MNDDAKDFDREKKQKRACEKEECLNYPALHPIEKV